MPLSNFSAKRPLFLLVLGTLISLLSLVPVGIARATAPYKASSVLGQTDFTGNSQYGSSGSPGSAGLYFPSGTVVDPVNHRLFVSDTDSNRVLVYNLSKTNQISGTSAADVLGQTDFTSTGGADTATGLWAPGQLALDPTRQLLFVTDTDNDRIMIFKVAPSTISDGEAAAYVIGQTDFTTDDYWDLGAATLELPQGVAYDAANQRLFVSDIGGYRVLAYDVSSITNGMPATNVLGQPDMVTDAGDGSFSSNQFSYPCQLAYDPNADRLYVVDQGSITSRVLAFNTATITNGEDAAYVLGQPDFTTQLTGETVTAQYFDNAWGIAFDPLDNRLLVGDGFGRILFFDTTALSNYPSAFAELGQADLTSTNVFDTPSPATSETEVLQAEGLSIDPASGDVFESDAYNNRVTEWDIAHITTTSLPDATTGQAYTASVAAEGQQGTTTFDLSSGYLPPGVSMGTNGAISGTPTKAGTYNFTVQVSDDNSPTGVFTNSQSLSITVGSPQTPVTPPVDHQKKSAPAPAPHTTTSTPTLPVPTSTPTVARALTPTVTLNTQSSFTVGGTVQIMSAGQAVAFELPDTAPSSDVSSTVHHATVNAIGSNYVDMTIASNPIHFKLYLGQTHLVDVNGAPTNNLQVTLVSIEHGQAKLLFKLLGVHSPVHLAHVAALPRTPQTSHTDVYRWLGIGCIVTAVAVAVGTWWMLMRRRPENIPKP